MYFVNQRVVCDNGISRWYKFFQGILWFLMIDWSIDSILVSLFPEYCIDTLVSWLTLEVKGRKIFNRPNVHTFLRLDKAW